ncbi:hypothetical protein [Chryseobacterium luteum]|uniref:Lipoprotein n=1 Tax=Chryseobacterium luteum TaxID=421531 RepID=A0A085YXP1_9FLAO|nr:hypothetical protein [Chryseobacterium luteum]KFE96954.1 hypothetical protein IX38_22385 [Chryseobacterium luteum]
MIKDILSFFLLFLFLNSCAQKYPSGNYTIITEVDEIGTGNLIDMKFELHFEKSKMFLRVDTNISTEAYCEGEYSIKKNKNKILVSKYIGEGICSSDSRINTIYIKKIENIYYIKSGRFNNDKWLKLKKVQ